MYKKEIKIGLGSFTIIVLAFVFLVVTICGVMYLGHIAKVNDKQNNNKQNSISTGIIGRNSLETNTLKNETKININSLYALTCKSVIKGNQYDKEDTLVAIDKNTGKETNIMKFNSGAYDYENGKIYFYENTANSYHRFYVINLEDGIEPREIYSFEKKYGTTDNLEYYENKLYYTFNGELLSISLTDNQINSIAVVKNYIFKINNETNTLYYVNDKEELVEMNLQTNEEKLIDTNSGVIDIYDNKLIYAKIEGNETWNWGYDLITGEKYKITESWRGKVGKNEIAIYNNSYIYINGEGQLVMLDEAENMQILTDEGNFEALTILPNNIILLERNEIEKDTDNYITYTYNIETKQLLQTQNNYRYSYIKYV